MNLIKLFEEVIKESKKEFYEDLLNRGFTPKEAKAIIAKGKTTIDEVNDDDLYDDFAIGFDDIS